MNDQHAIEYKNKQPIPTTEPKHNTAAFAGFPRDLHHSLANCLKKSASYGL
jgi:hypothetical protein